MGFPDNDEETEYYTNFSPPVYSRTSSVSSSNTGHDDLTYSSRSVNRWKNALRKIQSVDLDPWRDFPLESSLTQTAYRHRYSAIKKKWVVDEILIKMENTPFDHGAMRECFRLKKHPHQSSPPNDWVHASNYVAKRYIAAVDKQVYFDDVRLQMEAKLWAEAFNRQNPPKKVDIFQLSVLEIRDSKDSAESGLSKDDTSLAPPSGFYHIERYMEGEYRKYNSNSGFVDEQLRNTPQAFSHFTFERSGHRLLVVDIQGVGDLYTDPQIHTSDGVGYSDGNLGPRGMALFFHSHRCNPLCEWLGLTPFDLSASEIELQLQSAPKPSDAVQNNEDQNLKQKNVPLVGHKFVRRRTVSFNNHSKVSQSPSCSFGPTVARSTENTHFPVFSKPRRRCTSSSVHDGPLRASSSNSMDDETMFSNLFLQNATNIFDHSDILSHPNSQGLVDPLHTTHNTAAHVRPLLALDILPTRNHLSGPRNRALSGDSGYSGRLNPVVHLLTQHSVTELPSRHNDLGENINDFENPILASTSSLGDLPSPMSPVIAMTNNPLLGASASGSLLSPTDDVHDAFPSQTSSNASNHHFNRPSMFPRRQRNLSESSDIDAEENYRLAGNLLHQLMHESHKPSCADHPSNLDQEIGQSILGQIHHELARLHEAGRFLPSCKGGWSPAGLGGLLKQDEENGKTNPADLGFEQDEVNESQLAGPSNEPGVDWASVLFHERHAAQLGCLEAIIVMAHYYLGLPTQLLFDCPIKPNQGELRVGIDYLWRGAEGGDRRCMIILAWYLDVSVGLVNPNYKSNRITTPNDLLILPTLHSLDPETLNSVLPSISPDSWLEAVSWYKRAVQTATSSSDANNPDEGLDAEGGYDAAEDLLPVYRILARMAEMYSTGGFGLEQNYSMAGDLYSQAGESASNVHQGRLAAQYFELADKAYASVAE